MLPGGPLAKKQLTKLKIYYGENHPHKMQNPKEVDFLKLRKKYNPIMQEINTSSTKPKKIKLDFKIACTLLKEKKSVAKVWIKKAQVSFM